MPRPPKTIFKQIKIVSSKALTDPYTLNQREPIHKLTHPCPSICVHQRFYFFVLNKRIMYMRENSSLE